MDSLRQPITVALSLPLFLRMCSSALSIVCISESEPALDKKITEILRVVEEIQTHSKPMIERCYREFLLRSHDHEERDTGFRSLRDALGAAPGGWGVTSPNFSRVMP